MATPFEPSDEHVSDVARNLSAVRAQRDQIVQLAQALSNGTFTIKSEGAGGTPHDVEALEALTKRLQESVHARTADTARQIASALDEIASAVLSDVRQTATRIRALQETIIHPRNADAGAAPKSTNVIDGEVSVIAEKSVGGQ